jgi:TonB family protein
MRLQCTAAFMLLMVCIPVHAQATGDLTEPSVISSPIDYPASAVAARDQGKTLVTALVEADGHVSSAIVDKSSGHQDLDVAAQRSIAHWTFAPATRNGSPEARWVRVPITFQLHEVPSDVPVTHSSWPAIASSAAGFLGIVIWLFGFGWSGVLAKRQSIFWLSGMVALWLITYPLFIATHWSLAKRNLLVVVTAFAFLGIGFYLAPSNLPPGAYTPS